MFLVLAEAPAALVRASCIGASGSVALIGLVALVAGGTEERLGRPATARRLARASVPWIAAGSLAATVATLAVAATSVGASPLVFTAAAASIALGGAIGTLGGLARKPRPAAAIGLLLHVVGLGLAAGA